MQKASVDGLRPALDDRAVVTALSEPSRLLLQKREGNGDGDDDDDDGGEAGTDTFEDLGSEVFVDMPVVPKARQGAAFVRQDAAEIANGAQRVSCLFFFFLHLPARIHTRIRLPRRSFVPSQTP